MYSACILLLIFIIIIYCSPAFYFAVRFSFWLIKIKIVFFKIIYLTVSLLSFEAFSNIL